MRTHLINQEVSKQLVKILSENMGNSGASKCRERFSINDCS